MIRFFVNDGGYSYDLGLSGEEMNALRAEGKLKPRLDPISALLEGNRGYSVLIKEYLKQSYSDYELLLVAYYLEARLSKGGRLDWIGEGGYKVSNLSSKERAIQVSIKVPEAIVNGHLDQCRHFMVESTHKAVELVAPRFARRKIWFDKEGLLADLEKVDALFLSQGPQPSH